MTNELTVDSNQIATLPGPLVGFEREIDELRETGRLFYMRGWSVGTSSNYSAVVNREPLELIITASGKDKGRLEPHDFVRVDIQGTPVESDQPSASAETMLHCVLARLPDVGAILHTHSVWATLLSDHFFEDGGLVLKDFEMLKGLDGVQTHKHREWLPIFDNTQDIVGLSVELEKDLKNPTSRPIQHAFLLRHHGLYTWGKTVADARRHVEVLEFLFECVGRKIMLQGGL